MGLNDADIVTPWTLTAEDQALVMAKNVANRLGFALLFLFHRAHVDGDENPRIDGAVMSFSGPAALFEHRSPG
jgi:hypothetical protein